MIINSLGIWLQAKNHFFFSFLLFYFSRIAEKNDNQLLKRLSFCLQTQLTLLLSSIFAIRFHSRHFGDITLNSSTSNNIASSVVLPTSIPISTTVPSFQPPIMPPFNFNPLNPQQYYFQPIPQQQAPFQFNPNVFPTPVYTSGHQNHSHEHDSTSHSH